MVVSIFGNGTSAKGLAATLTADLRRLSGDPHFRVNVGYLKLDRFEMPSLAACTPGK